MKILVVGVFQNKWSTIISMAKELKLLGHSVVLFDYRYKRRDNSVIETNLSVNKQKKAKITTDLKHFFVKTKFYSYLKGWVEKITKIPYEPFQIIRNTYLYYLFGRWAINRQLLREIKRNHYDLIFLTKTEVINYNLIPKMWNYAKVWYYFMDPLDKALEIKAYKYACNSNWSSASSTSVVNLFKKKGANAFFITQGVNTRVFKPLNYKKEIDVIFVGSKSKKRAQYIDIIKRNGFDIECFGPGWKKTPIYLKELNKKYNLAKIVLNFPRTNVGFSIRVFQSMGSGSFTLSEYCKDIEKVFQKEKHIDWFKNKEELINLLDYYIKNEEKRELIAKNAHSFVYKHYSWDIIMKKIMKIIESG